jgi:hypothetical protein
MSDASDRALVELIMEMHPRLRSAAYALSALHDASMEAYRLGDLVAAEELDAKYAETIEAMDALISGLEEDFVYRAELEPEPYGSREEADLLREFAAVYHHYASGRPYQGVVLSLHSLGVLLRGAADDYGLWLGPLQPGITDDYLIGVAKEAYDTAILMRNR